LTDFLIGMSGKSGSTWIRCDSQNYHFWTTS